jgi:hypothetical protein
MTQLPPNWVMPTCARASKVKYIQTEAEQSRESKTTIHIETAVVGTINMTFPGDHTSTMNQGTIK